MALNGLKFRMFNLCTDTKILRDKENGYFAYLPFFPTRSPNPQNPYGYLETDSEVIHYFSKEEWSSLMCITC